MSPIETIVRPRRNRITVPVPKEYSSYSFQVILVPLAPIDSTPPAPPSTGRKKKNFIEALMSCPCDISDLIGDRSDDPPSFFERSGGFDSEPQA